MLGLEEMGLSDALLGWINEHSSGTLWLVKKTETNTNPFDPPTITYSVVISTIVVAVEQLSGEHVRRLFGTNESTYYSVTSSISDSMVMGVTVGLYAVVDYSGIQIIKGVVERIDRELDGSAIIYINTSEAVPNGVIAVAQ